jgi:hypothetical protein
MSTFRKKRKKVNKPKENPESQLIFEEICDIFRKTGVEVRLESGYFKGGICFLKENHILFINKDLPLDQNIDVLLGQLDDQHLENIYISPLLRSKIKKSDTTIEV